MFCARVFNGIGTGNLNAITPVWATETAEHTSRGQFVAIEFTGRRVQLVIWLQIWQEWIGIAGMSSNPLSSSLCLYCINQVSHSFQPTIFGLAGFSSNKSQWLSGVNTITYTLSTLMWVFTLDRIGRRWTLYWYVPEDGASDDKLTNNNLGAPPLKASQCSFSVASSELVSMLVPTAKTTKPMLTVLELQPWSSSLQQSSVLLGSLYHGSTLQRSSRSLFEPRAMRGLWLVGASAMAG